MLGLDEEHQEYQHISGSLFTLPEFTLTSGKQYLVEATLLSYNNSKELAKDSVSISAMKRPILVGIFPNSVEIGVDRPIMFEVIVVNFNNNDEMQVDWECTSDDGEKCSGGIVQNHTKFDIAFKSIGRFVFEDRF